MISVDEALERILSYVNTLEVEDQPILAALGQVTGEDIASDIDIPPLDNTAMDGYAVRSRDTRGASHDSPVSLRVIGEVAAGYISRQTIQLGTAVRIMTGASIPTGADAVVPFEDSDEPFEEAPNQAKALEARVQIFREVRPGANIRRAGEDIANGQLTIQEGTILRPAEIGILASLGRDRVRVIRRPIVAVLSTGDELLEIGEPAQPGKIYDSNAHSLAALIKRTGGIPKMLGIARDTVGALTDKIDEGLDADMLITSAGVSRGDYDVVKNVLASKGEIAFWTVAMKPGKPLAFGTFKSQDRNVPHIGLPGNPVSSMVVFELFARPALFKMMGKTRWQRPLLRAITNDQITNRGERRRFYARCIVSRNSQDGQYYASLTGPQGSGILSSMMYANALTVIQAGREVVEPGEEIDVMMLDWSRGEEWSQTDQHIEVSSGDGPDVDTEVC